MEESRDGTGEAGDWARRLVAEKAWVMHLHTNSIGRATRYFTAQEGDRFVSPINGDDVLAPVLQLDSGSALVATDPTCFMRLTVAQLGFYELTSAAIAKTLEECAIWSHAALKDDPETGLVLMVAALRAQLGELTRRPG